GFACRVAPTGRAPARTQASPAWRTGPTRRARDARAARAATRRARMPPPRGAPGERRTTPRSATTTRARSSQERQQHREHADAHQEEQVLLRVAGVQVVTGAEDGPPQPGEEQQGSPLQREDEVEEARGDRAGDLAAIRLL